MSDDGRSGLRLTVISCVALVFLLAGCSGKPAEPETTEADSGVYVTSDPLPPPPPPPPPPSIFDPSKSDAVAWLAELPREQRGASSAKGAVEGLFQTHIERKQSGVPWGEAVPAYRRWLSSRLREGMAAAALERDRMIAEHPGAKPPHVEGDRFSGFENGPTGFEVKRRIASENGRVVFEVRLWEVYRDETYEHAERVVAAREAGRWVVEDIIFSGEPDGQPDHRLSDSLPSESAQ